MANTDQGSPLRDNAQLETLCRDFLASRYYRKAIEDIRYEREQAIRDFLTEQISLQSLAQLGQLEAVVIVIRQSYYRYF